MSFLNKVINRLIEAEDNKPLYILYAGIKGSGKLHQQFSDSSRASCADEFKEQFGREYDKDGKKVKYSHKIIKVTAGEKAPTTLEESVNDDSINSEEQVVFTTQGKQPITMPLQAAMSLMRKRFDDNSVDLYFNALLNGKVIKFTLDGTTVMAKLKAVMESAKRCETLKSHIEATESKMKSMPRDSSLYKDTLAQLNRFKKELSQYDKLDESKDVDIGDGYTVSKVGKDVNGNSSYWVKKDGKKAKKVQHVGNIDGSKCHNKKDLAKDTELHTKIKAYHKKYNEKIDEARVRTTEDEFTLQGNYGQGWEDLTSATTFKEIRQHKREYLENEPGTPLKIIKRRIKKTVQG